MNVDWRFSFIWEPQLKSEIDQNFKFIIGLVDLFDKLKDDNSRFWYKKTIVILTASIVEAILLYTIKQLELKHSRCFWIKKTREKLIYKIWPSDNLYTYREKKVAYDPEEMTFNDSIVILWDEEPTHFTKDICDKIHGLRRLRNGVHVHNGVSSDPEFITLNFETFFTNAKIAIDTCEAVLS